MDEKGCKALEGLDERIIYSDKYGQYTKISIRVSGSNEYRDVFIDLDDINLLTTGNRWIINKYGYVTRRYRCGGGRYELHYLHRDIINTSDVVDHKDGNTLNCRKYNLRCCTQSQNAKNMRISTTNTSGVKGVCWDKSRKKWKAEICVDYKKIMLGRFDIIDDAIRARKDAEAKYFGEFNRE